MKKTVLPFFLALFLEGCSADIEPSASNSISAILAVFGEYTFAILSLFLFNILRAITILGGGIVTIGAIHMFESSPFYNINPTYLFLTGITLILVGSLQPNNFYKPQITIAHNSRKKDISINKKDNKFLDILVQIFSGVMTGIILHICGI